MRRARNYRFEMIDLRSTEYRNIVFQRKTICLEDIFKPKLKVARVRLCNHLRLPCSIPQNEDVENCPLGFLANTPVNKSVSMSEVY